jgi:hypothetical protein
MSQESSRTGSDEVALKDLGSAPDYGEYESCFNSGRYYEAHDALEPRWLQVRHRREGPFLKGLIQLAGAFVHVQKGRLGPANALLARARHHLAPFSTSMTPLDVPAVLELIRGWSHRVTKAAPGDLLLSHPPLPTLPRAGQGNRVQS